MKHDRISLSQLSQDFIGLNTCYTLACGKSTPRRYMDSAASNLMMKGPYLIVQRFLDHYANTHSHTHFGAKIASYWYEWAHRQVLRFVNASHDEYLCVFVGQGSTTIFNRLARQLYAARPKRNTVLVSSMEHHSNDLPHRQHTNVIHFPLQSAIPAQGTICLGALEDLLTQHQDRVNYIALTASSNVTGVINPIKDVARLAQQHDVYSVIDASQIISHSPIDLSDNLIDCLVFSGHKCYAPGSPGVLIIKKELMAKLAPDELGGGVISDVQTNSYELVDDLTSRSEAGTPNIPGALLLGLVLEVLERTDMPIIQAHEQALLHQAQTLLKDIPEVQLYGLGHDVDIPRTSILAFNLKGLDHGLVSSILNDYHNISVRNECFCAHPYVRDMLKPELWALNVDPDTPEGQRVIDLKRGMIRVSFAVYNTSDDVNALVEGIKDIIENRQYYQNLYTVDKHNIYQHRHFQPKVTELFALVDALDEYYAG